VRQLHKDSGNVRHAHSFGHGRSVARWGAGPSRSICGRRPRPGARTRVLAPPGARGGHRGRTVPVVRGRVGRDTSGPSGAGRARDGQGPTMRSTANGSSRRRPPSAGRTRR